MDRRGETPLSHASKYNRASIVQYLCSQGADVTTYNSQAFTAGHYAAACGSVEILEMLHENGADLVAPNILGWTPLHYAVKYNHTQATEYLLRINAIPAGEEESQNLTNLAASVNCLPVIQALLATGGQVDAVNHNQWTFLTFAASNGHADLMRTLRPLLSEELFMKVDRYNRNLAHLAAIGGYLDVLQFLEEIGFALFDEADHFGKKPLHYAAEADNASVIPYLIQKSDVNSADRDGNTALHLAAVNGSYEALALLTTVEKVHIDQTNNFEKSPLFAAVSAGENQSAVFLLKKGADPNLTVHGRTLITEAVCAGSSDMVAQLCDTDGVDIFKTDCNGWSPVHYAAQLGDVRDISLFETKDHDAVLALTSNGRTPVDVAAIWNRPEVIVYYSHIDGIDFNNKDIDQNTAMHHAIQRGHAGVARDLFELSPVSLKEQNKKQQTPLHIAIETWQLELVAEMIMNGECDFSAKDYMGRTPFLLAVELSQSSTVDLLLNSDTHLKPDEADVHGNTAPHLAAGLNCANVLRKLHVSGRFNFQVQNKRGQTPLDIAAEREGECLRYMARVLGVKLVLENEEEEEEIGEEEDPELELFKQAEREANEEEEIPIEEEEEEEADGEKENDEEKSDSSDFLHSYAFEQVKKHRSSSVSKRF